MKILRLPHQSLTRPPLQVVNIMDMEVPTTIEYDDIYIVSGPTLQFDLSLCHTTHWTSPTRLSLRSAN